MDQQTSRTRGVNGAPGGDDSRVGSQNTPLTERERGQLGNNIAALARRFVMLIDLQLQLLVYDLRQFWAESQHVVLIGVLAGAMLLASIPVFLLGLAGFVQRGLGCSAEFADVLTGTTAAAVAATALVCCVRRVAVASRSLHRSRNELQNNLEWMREVLNQQVH